MVPSDVLRRSAQVYNCLLILEYYDLTTSPPSVAFPFNFCHVRVLSARNRVEFLCMLLRLFIQTPDFPVWVFIDIYAITEVSS